jgi:hypothetical protein
MTRNLVQIALSCPEKLPALMLNEWDLLIRQGQATAVLGTIAFRLEQNDLLRDVPTAARTHLEAARNVGLHHKQLIRQEAYCIDRALRKVDTDIVLLKGAAYGLAGLLFAEGRLQSDVDILVPKSKLLEVESALLNDGWQSMNLDEYAQRYYRQWTHELPPLFHPDRGTVIDVHHNILPAVGRLRPRADMLLSAAENIPNTRFKRLCSSDMVLHASAHMFQDGFLDRGLRELADIDGLLRTFSASDGFWDALIRRAGELDLRRPLFYALRYSSLYLGTAIPESVISASMAWRPALPLVRSMDRLVSRALMPQHLTSSSFEATCARWLLYMRSHWLRMPPMLLMRHVLHHAIRGLSSN